MKSIFLYGLVLLSQTCFTQVKFHQIPAWTFTISEFPSSEFPISKMHKTTYNLKDFSISEQITFKEYKIYLVDMRKDSGQAFYKRQLPDSNMCLKEAYKKYINSKEFDNYPVLGISWESALNYCKWKTLKENKDSLLFYYRLPHQSEWFIANDYLTKQKIKNDFSKDYADWTLEAFDESAYDFEHDMNHEYEYFALPNEANVLKRKRIMGDSYKFQSNDALQDGYGYSFEGYAHVAFRLVKEAVTPQIKAQKPTWEKQYIEALKTSVKIPRPHNILQYWGFYLK